jgi:hypothetical protein
MENGAMTRDEEKALFNNDRIMHIPEGPAFVRDSRGWILFGPKDVRGGSKVHQFCLQKLPTQKFPRVRVGCRYYTLQQAWKHWGVRKRGQYSGRRNECNQAVALIRLMLLQAQAFGLIFRYSTPIKFDSTIIKPKRK